MTRSRIVFTTLGALFFSAVAFSGASAQAAKKGRSYTDRPAATRGTTTDLPSADRVNKAGQKATQPVAKGGAKTRGGACDRLHVDNRTDWYIRIYVDGEVVGQVGPWGDVYGTYCGESELRAAAYFEDGSIVTWGPRTYDFSNGPGTWTLRK